MIKPIDTELKVHQEKEKSLELCKVTRTFSMHITLALIWKIQFVVIHKKMNRSITKIRNMNISSFQGAIYFSICIIKSVFFRCGIV